jgi:hypothetical protein
MSADRLGVLSMLLGPSSVVSA